MLLPSFTSWTLVLTATSCIDVASAFYAIPGVKTGVTPDGYRPPRRDLNDLYKDTNQFSLYIQALTAFMSAKETALTSYFQVAGIHGRPYIAWDNVNPKPGEGVTNMGYCTHGNVLFPTWHRPYMALYEQIIAGHAQTAAKAYNSPVWTKAADQLRIPFWDWAAAPQGFPDIMTWPSIRITTPTGVKNVTNPLYRYKFQQKPEPKEWFPMDDGDWDAYLGSQPWTSRWPDANNVSHDEAINIRLAGNDIPAGLRSQVWNVFSQNIDYNTMASVDNRGYTFENPHNSIHVWVGGDGDSFGGFMSSVPFSSFDPAFWLHHTNVDRQIAMWQAIYPQKWIVPIQSGGATWTITPGSTLDENTPLTPFTMGDGRTAWTSKSARFTKAFGYSYPDVKDWLFTDPKKLAANVTKRVNQLYNADGALVPRSLTELGGIKGRRMAVEKRNDTKRSWTLSTKIPNSAVGSAFSVLFSTSSIPIGRLDILAAPSQQEVDAGAKKVTYGDFDLNEVLGKSGVDVGDVEGVVEKLKSGLRWEVVRRDGEAVGAVEGLGVQVSEREVLAEGSEEEFPSYGERVVHKGVGVGVVD